MKKALGILSVLVLITVMLISCNAEQKLDDTVGVSFNVSSSRELSVANESFVAVDSSDLTWYYHGEKKTDTEFITGQSASMTEGEDGYWTRISTGILLSNTYVTFSQGQWSFEIKAMKGDTQMYYGKTNGNVLLTKGNNTISISVSPFVSGVKGTLKIDSVYIDPKNAGSDNVAPNKLIVNGTEKTFDVNEGGKSISFTEPVEPGTYTVEVKRVGEDTGIVLASASKTVVVYSGLTTTIYGSVEEDTTSGTFDPQPIKPEGTETVTVSETGYAVVKFVNVTPSMEADKSTTVTIPSAVVPSTSNPVTLDIVVKDSESVADSSFDVTTGNGVAASISLTMKEGETPITDFGSDKVTVETYIETGLSGVKVKYNGEGAADPEESDTEYDPVTGKLTFKTTHFSEFYVEADIQAKIGTIEYCLLQKAFDAAEDGDTVVLLSNVDPVQTLVVSKNITLDMNGKTISNTNDIWNDATGDWSLISVRGGDLTVTGEGSLRGKANDCFALDVMDEGNLVIENGTFVGNCHAVYVYEGSLLVNGGEYSVIQKYSASYPDEYVLNCYDSSYKNGTASIVVKGGKFHGFNPANCRAEGEGTSFIVDWYSSKNIGTESEAIYEVGSAVDDEEISISTLEGLLEFARLVNKDGHSFVGQTIKLVSDIDLNNINWIPVGQTSGYSAETYFQGTFDGNGKTISNLTIPERSWEAGQNEGKNYATGFFGFVDVGNTIIKDVTFENAVVEGHHWVGVVAGYMTGTVEGVTVKNATVSSTYETSEADGDKAGGVVGCLNSGSVTGCTVNGSTISAIRDCGSVVGYSTNNGTTIAGNTAENCTVYYSTDKDDQIGGEIAGKRSSGVSDNTANNVSVIRLVSSANELSTALNHTYSSNTIIKLANDISLEDVEWGEHTLKMGSSVNVTIDGNGKTVSNLSTNTTTNANGFFSNGLITSVTSTHHSTTTLGTLTVKNLTVDSAVLSSEGTWPPASSGVVAGDVSYAHFVAENCTITNADVTSTQYAAGFVGYCQQFNYGETITLKDCSVSGSTFNGNDATGALIGLSNTAVTINGATVTGNTINGGAGFSASALVGTSIGGTTATDVTASENTFSITNDTGYQNNNPSYGYIYHNNATYSVDGTSLNQ